MAQPSRTRIPLPPPSRLKRQNENLLAPPEKKRKMEPPTKTPFAFTKSTSLSKLGGIGRFSEAPKRGILRPQTSAENIRESMPAFSLAKTVQKAPPPAVSKPRKIPAWDLKGRVEQMEKINMNLTEKLQTVSHRVVALEDDKTKLNVDVAIKSQQSEEATAIISNLESELKSKTKSLKEETEIKETLQRQNDLLLQENRSKKYEAEALKTELESHRSLVSQLSAELNVKKISEDELRKENERMKIYSQEMEEKVKEYEAKMQLDETLRRHLHNTIQELKGNIRVFCRIRPPLHEELESNQPMSIIHMKNDFKTLEIDRSSDSVTELHSKVRSNFEFTFDAIFDSTSHQDNVFLEISQLVQSVLDGFNVCIFAYGQTGSGKTYTMEGPPCISSFLTCDKSELGMIPRSVQQIFSAAKLLESKGWKYTMEASFMEIYNETIRDLLAVHSPKSTTKCQIKRSANNGIDGYISNVKHVAVASEREVYGLLQKARTNRVVATTNCNEHSSRSHYVFQMKLAGKNEMTDESCEGILNLVDLAGSERIKESGSAGDRLTEAKNINKSLSNLGNVIMALSQKADHIPYRNSKLTHLLMNSLGGNSKTLMFVNINPCEQNFSETVNSLRFATKVNQCQIGTAQKKIK